MSNRFHASRATAAWRVTGQAMVEYTIVLAFGVMMLYGPGGNVIRELEEVFRNNYRGYSYAMSLSALPDFGNGEDYRTYIDELQLDPALDDATLDRLAVDPVQEAISSALEPYADVTSGLSDISGLIGDPATIMSDLAEDMLTDAINITPF
ncbi:MAG: hypothetical protein O7B81_16805 [Gammaproteobacteria bacterium]|nr:hypothetical protein [Gammaproteobacteria bacterium]